METFWVWDGKGEMTANFQRSRRNTMFSIPLSATRRGRKSTAAAGIRPPVRNPRQRSGSSAGTVSGGVPPLRETPDMLSVPKSSAGIGHGVQCISLHRREHLYCHPFPATSTKKWMTPLTLWPSGPQSAARHGNLKHVGAHGRSRNGIWPKSTLEFRTF